MYKALVADLADLAVSAADAEAAAEAAELELANVLDEPGAAAIELGLVRSVLDRMVAAAEAEGAILVDAARSQAADRLAVARAQAEALVAAARDDVFARLQGSLAPSPTRSNRIVPIVSEPVEPSDLVEPAEAAEPVDTVALDDDGDPKRAAAPAAAMASYDDLLATLDRGAGEETSTDVTAAPSGDVDEEFWHEAHAAEQTTGARLRSVPVQILVTLGAIVALLVVVLALVG